MFGLGIRYLNGWAMAAADGAKKERAEWPPHPDRVFMALAAAWFETGKVADEGDALLWLERLPTPPGIMASRAEYRHAFKDNRPVTSYVPVNDVVVAGTKKISSVCADPESSLGDIKAAGLAMLAEFRPRQPRAFPVAIPHDPVVYLVWQSDLLDTHRERLAALCRKVVSIGHSASLVQMWLTDSPPMPNLVPMEGMTAHRLRVFGAGRLQYLEVRLNREAVILHADLEAKIKSASGKQRKTFQAELQARFPAGGPVSLRPEPGLWQGYDKPSDAEPLLRRGSIFDPRLIVLALSGKQLSLPATLKITEALRGALMAACPEPIPEWISGHKPDGKPSEKPHVAFLALPFVGDKYADGRLMGVALALPRDLDPAQTDKVLTTWLRDEHGQPHRLRLFNGQWLECVIELEMRESPPLNLQFETWTRPSKRWGTVTPVVLDRHFDGTDKWDRAAETVKDACERVGLPRPVEVLLHPVSLFQGSPKSGDFPSIKRKKDGGRMHHAHAVILFDEAVAGPLIVGAGRFRGYGLCRPIPYDSDDHA